ncbi:hypothetical protein JHK82_055344 [Glycine max]|nr:hypothetical protein JHK85_056159 [Glycine max]KAG5073973.1 hypothetical protein JHK84_055204 [Glycine max]KAG5076649.1 hypothetical protein JHK82_055344 [Glycine max]
MDQALAVNFLAMPKRANTPPKVDYSKCGRYHRNHGHSTKEYTTLKAKMEELIKLGHLKKMTTECYMASLRIHPYAREQAPKVLHFIEARKKTEGVKELELNLRTNDDNRVKPVEETSIF